MKRRRRRFVSSPFTIFLFHSFFHFYFYFYFDLFHDYRLEKVNKKMEKSVDDAGSCRATFEEALVELNRRIDQEKQQYLPQQQQSNSGAGTGGNSTAGKKKGAGSWSPEELNLLIKAVNLFPAGTNQRWEVVANFINQHHGGNRAAKEVLAQAKELQQSDFSRSALKEAANKAAYNKFEKDQKGGTSDESVPSERYESMSPSHTYIYIYLFQLLPLFPTHFV